MLRHVDQKCITMEGNSLHFSCRCFVSVGNAWGVSMHLVAGIGYDTKTLWIKINTATPIGGAHVQCYCVSRSLYCLRDHHYLQVGGEGEGDERIMNERFISI